MDYIDPTTVGELVDALGSYGSRARILAGGQTLLPLLFQQRLRAEVLIALDGVAGLHDCSIRHGELAIGAMCRQADLERDPRIRGALPLLAAAALHVAPQEVRNRGTLCGSLAFAHPCAAFPAAVAALGGVITAVSRRGRRQIPASGFVLSPWHTCLDPDELLESVSIPAQDPACGWAIHTFRESALRYPVAGAVVVSSASAAGGTSVTCFGRGIGLQQADLPDALIAGEARSGAGCWAGLVCERIDVGPDEHLSAASRRTILRAVVERALVGAASSLTERVMRHA
jgi:CO/xanthine dehydrogenase FAD-binding subunit